MLGMSTTNAQGVECPQCQVPNPDHDPDNPYESDQPCIACCENEPCDAGQGCGCCVDGECWAPTPNCPDPLDINFIFLRAGGCPCEPCQLGCMVPYHTPPTYDASVCYKTCAWKPAPSSITIRYFEGLCPERCNSIYNSPGDATEANYCDVLAKLDESIAKAQQAIANPPDPSDCDNPPPESYCFSDCMADHEAVHVEQLRCMWEDMKSEIIEALSDISVPFDCEIAKTPEDAAAAMNEAVKDVLKEQRDKFFSEWYRPNTIRQQEIEAYQDTLECLQALRSSLLQHAIDNNWKGCN